MAAGKKDTKRDPLSRDRIVRTALSIIDRDGLEAISMRRVGDELGVEAMSLYNHVGNKAALLDGVFELVLSGLDAPANERRSSSWRVVLKRRAHSLRSLLREHPNTLPLFATRPAVTPASIAHVESTLALLRRAGFSPRESLCALQVVVAYVVGHAMASFAPRDHDSASAPRYDLLSEPEFPHVHEIAALLTTYDLEDEFEVGLDAMLDGLERKKD